MVLSGPPAVTGGASRKGAGRGGQASRDMGDNPHAQALQRTIYKAEALHMGGERHWWGTDFAEQRIVPQWCAKVLFQLCLLLSMLRTYLVRHFGAKLWHKTLLILCCCPFPPVLHPTPECEARIRV